MPESFIYNANPARILFGAGMRAKLPEEAARLGLKRVLLLATPQQADEIARLAQELGDIVAATFAGAAMHTPVEVTARALEVVSDERIDGLVAVGGGSTTGLSKAIAFQTNLPQIVLPTTYAGSEVTPILGETKDGRKVTRTDPRVLPEVVIYDVDLTLTLPQALSVTSGMNAVAHAVEALYARERNPIVSLMAEQAIAAFARALPRIAADSKDLAARSDALFGAWLAGNCLGSVGMALHHKLCHVLGGAFNLPHAETHTAVLPHSAAYNAPDEPAVMARVAAALGAKNAAPALYDLAAGLGATMALRDLGMPEEGIDKATEMTLSNPYWNPRPLEREVLRQTIAAAWSGVRPAD